MSLAIEVSKGFVPCCKSLLMLKLLSINEVLFPLLNEVSIVIGVLVLVIDCSKVLPS